IHKTLRFGRAGNSTHPKPLGFRKALRPKAISNAQNQKKRRNFNKKIMKADLLAAMAAPPAPQKPGKNGDQVARAQHAHAMRTMRAVSARPDRTPPQGNAPWDAVDGTGHETAQRQAENDGECPKNG